MGSCSSKPEPPPASSTALATPSTEVPAAEKPAEKPAGGWFDTASSDATESSGEKAPAERRPSIWALVRQKSAENLVEPFSGSPIGQLFKQKREYAKTRLADLREHLDSMPNHPAHACADEKAGILTFKAGEPCNGTCHRASAVACMAALSARSR